MSKGTEMCSWVTFHWPSILRKQTVARTQTSVFSHFLFLDSCKCLLNRDLSIFLISQKWLQAHLEIIKDLLLVGLGNGDFVELNSCHEDRFATDRRQAFDGVAHCPLSVFVGTVSGKQRL